MAQFVQPVDGNDQFNGSRSKVFTMIDNYIYLYHTDTMIIVPTYPQSLSDSTAVRFSESTPLARSAPIYSFSGSGPRQISVALDLHRDMMNEINTNNSLSFTNKEDVDYVDILINEIEAAALPRYSGGDKMVIPPVVAVKFGADIFCKGVVTSGVTKTYNLPILKNNKYALVNISFTLSEIDPFDADSVMKLGSYRG